MGCALLVACKLVAMDGNNIIKNEVSKPGAVVHYPRQVRLARRVLTVKLYCGKLPQLTTEDSAR